MINIIFTIAVFLSTVIIHIFLYRKMQSKKEVSLAVFMGGLIFVILINLFILKKINYQINDWIDIHLPYSSIFIYILLTGSYFILLTSVILDDISPSTNIYTLIRQKKKMNLNDLINHFSDESLILKRLTELKKAGFVYKNGKYKLLTKGKIFISLMIHYKRLLGWEVTG